MKLRTANEAYRYNKQYRLDKSRGLVRHVSPDVTLAHINLLKDRGWSVSGMAETSGISDQTIHRIVRGDREHIHRDTQEAILSLRDGTIFERSRPTGYVPKIGAQRRLQALMAMGWRHSDTTAILGFSSSNILHQPGPWITRSKHDAMCRAYDQLWDQPGPSASTAARAIKAGYLLPMAWDEGTIDNPDHLAVLDTEPGKKREANSVAFIGEVEFFVSIGADRYEIAERLNETPDSLMSRLRRHGREDLAAKINPSHQLVGARP